MEEGTVPAENFLQGSICLVTGASRGIGAAIAQAVSRRGARTVINYLNSANKALELQDKLNQEGHWAWALQGDVSDPGEVERIFTTIEQRWGAVDILINNAGTDLRALVTETSDADWQRVMDVNLKAPFLCSRRALPNMIRQRQGRIINISSVFGICGAAFESAYAASKGGLIAFTKSLASELGPSGITVNAIAPGPIETDMLHTELNPAELQNLSQEIPLGRLGKPEEIAAACLYLLSPGSGFITGQVITIDGGWKL